VDTIGARNLLYLVFMLCLPWYLPKRFRGVVELVRETKNLPDERAVPTRPADRQTERVRETSEEGRNRATGARGE